MKEKLRYTPGALMLVVLFAASVLTAAAQTGPIDNRAADKKGVTPQSSGPTLPVLGSGTIGQLTKWTGLTSSNSILGDSIITETKLGNIGIGTTTPTSKLTVQGMIETTLGGFKFPDGTLQTTAAVSGLSSIFHDATLSGNGTSASPLGISIPLLLNGSTGATAILTAGNQGAGDGVSGSSPLGRGIVGVSQNNVGVFGASNVSAGVRGESENGTGVIGRAGNVAFKQAPGIGVHGVSDSFAKIGVLGESVSGRGVLGSSETGVGVIGITEGDLGFIFVAGVSGSATTEIGVVGQSSSGAGVSGFSDSGNGVEGVSTSGKAGKFRGDVEVTGNLSKGGGSFKIDHPLDPENKYLYHSFVESPDMMNIYNGNVITDESAQAVVTLPGYFEALNRDFRYQLTVIGQFAQAIVEREVKEGRFIIRTSAPNVKVSWQVTGIRQDAWANKHRIATEEEKPEQERGFYLHPEVHDKPEERGIEWARRPELMQRVKDMQKSKQQ